MGIAWMRWDVTFHFFNCSHYWSTVQGSATVCLWSLILYRYCRPSCIVDWMWFHWKGWNVRKRKWMSFTVCDKLDDLSKADAHTGMFGDLALKLSTWNKTEKLWSNWRKLRPVWDFFHAAEIIEISFLKKLENALAAWLLSQYIIVYCLSLWQATCPQVIFALFSLICMRMPDGVSNCSGVVCEITLW